MLDDRCRFIQSALTSNLASIFLLWQAMLSEASQQAIYDTVHGAAASLFILMSFSQSRHTPNPGSRPSLSFQANCGPDPLLAA